MTRNENTESLQRMATEQELKVAEKAREHQVELETEIEVEKQKAAELRYQVQTVKKSLEEQQHKTDHVWKGVTQKQQEMQQTVTKPGRLQQRKPKNEKHEMEVEIEVVARLGRKLSPSHRPEGLEVPEDIDKERSRAHPV